MAFPDGWTKKWAITTDHTLVPSDQGASKLFFNSANLPASIFTYARSDGGDIRITTDLAGASQIPVEVVFFDAVNSRCEIWAKGDLHSAADDTFYIWFGNPSATMPAASDTYGRNNVWQTHLLVHHFQEASGNYINSVGNTTYDGVVTNVTRSVAGAFGAGGFCASFPVADNARVVMGSPAALAGGASRTINAWIKLTGFGGSSLGRIVSEETAAHAGNGLCVRALGTGTIRGQNQPSNAEGATNALTTGAWYFVGLTRSSASPALWNLYVNGILTGVADQSIAVAIGGQNVTIGANANADTTRNFDGLIDELRINAAVDGANAQAMMNTIQSDPGAMFPTTTEIPIAIGEHSTFRGIGRGIGRGIM